MLSIRTDAQDRLFRLNEEIDLKNCYGSNCEYVLFSLADISCDHTSVNKAYDVIHTFRFPLCMLPENRDAIFRLSKDDQHLLFENEYKFLSKMLTQVDSSLRILPIPKSLYQLFIYASLVKFDASEKCKNYQIDYDDIATLDYLHKTFNYKDSTQSDYTAYCEQHFKDSACYQEWLAVNQEIATELCKVIELYKKQPEAAIRQMHNNANSILFTEGVKTLDKNSFFRIGFHRLTLPRAMRMSRHIIAREWSTGTVPNTYTLYRSGNLKSDIAIANNTPTSLSYSDGLYAGIWQDFSSGSALAISTMGSQSIYALNINKIAYFNNGEDAQCLFIPPISTYAAFKGKGEFHHPRSKVSRDVSIDSSNFGTTCKIRDEQLEHSDESHQYTFLYANTTKLLTHASKLTAFLKENAKCVMKSLAKNTDYFSLAEAPMRFFSMRKNRTPIKPASSPTLSGGIVR